MVNWQKSCWKRTTLLTDRAVRLSTAKTYVFSDSVLCMGRISEHPVSARKEKIDWFMIHTNVEIWIESTGADGARVEKFHWIHFIAESRRDPKRDD